MRRLTVWLMLGGVSAVPGSALGQDSLKLREPLVRPSLQARPNAGREQITGLVATVALSPGSIALEQGSTLQMGASLRSVSGTPLRGVSLSWQSSNPAVAQVDPAGVVTAVEPGGPVTITATSGTASGSATVTVSAIPPLRGEASSYGTSVMLGSMTPGLSIERRSYFSSTGDVDRWYGVQVIWPQPSGCSPGAAIGPVFSVRLTGVPAGRQYDLSLRKDYATVVQESRQPGNQDQNVSVGGVCGTSSATYFVQVHRSSGLPTSAPFTLRFTEGT
jgi:Bacterial Ig-like domain (group 2)